MLTVLEIGKRRRRTLGAYIRSGFRPPRLLTVRQVKGGIGCFRVVTIYPDKRGGLPWEAVREAAGGEARHLLCPEGLVLPEEKGLAPFQPTGQLQCHLMQLAAWSLLKQAARQRDKECQRRLSAGVYDPQGTRPDLAVSLLPYAAEVRVATGRPERYRTAQRVAMEEYGATLTFTQEQGSFAGIQLLLLAEQPDRLLQGGGLILTPFAIQEKRMAGDFIPRKTGKTEQWLAGCPEGIEPGLFLAGLYERSGVRDMVEEPPESALLAGRRRPLPDLLSRLPGLDIGGASSYNKMTI